MVCPQGEIAAGKRTTHLTNLLFYHRFPLPVDKHFLAERLPLLLEHNGYRGVNKKKKTEP